jgi:hypothetical protein
MCLLGDCVGELKDGECLCLFNKTGLKEKDGRESRWMGDERWE